MTTVVDIRCPNCDRARTVGKVGIGRYRCDECDLEFGRGDVLPE